VTEVTFLFLGRGFEGDSGEFGTEVFDPRLSVGSGDKINFVEDKDNFFVGIFGEDHAFDGGTTTTEWIASVEYFENDVSGFDDFFELAVKRTAGSFSEIGKS